MMRGAGPALPFLLATGLAAAAAAGESARTSTGWIHEHWTVADGLPVNSINDLLQSRDGYLWLATFDGLTRFDGLRFRVFDTGNSPGLPSNRIIRLHEQREGPLWLLTEQGHVVGLADGVFHTLPVVGDERRRYRILVEDTEGTIWLGGLDGIGRIEGDRIVPFAPDDVSGHVTALLLDRRGAVWAGSVGGGVFRIDSDRVERFSTHRPGRPTAAIATISEGSDGTIRIGFAFGALVYEDGKLLPLRVNGNAVDRVVAFHETPDGTLWLGTGSGLFRVADGRLVALDERSGSPSIKHPIRSSPSGATWFATATTLYREGDRVSELPGLIGTYLFDHEGSVWIGTATDGLWRLKPSLFEVWGEPEGIGEDNVYPVMYDDVGLWIGTYGQGLTRLSGGTVTRFGMPELPGWLVRALHRDRDGTLWVGFHGSGVCRFEAGRCTPVGREHGLYGTVLAILQDREGTYWFGTQEAGLLRHRNGAWRRFTREDGLPSDTVRVIVETANGTLWLGTNGGGISRVDGDSFRNISTSDGLSSDLIRSIYEDREGALWIGTEGRGLNRLVIEGDEPSISVFRKRDGLFDEVIHSILEDDFGRLWMSSNRGIFWVSLSELRAFAAGESTEIRPTFYTERDGLRSREANGGVQPAGAKSDDGRLWFPTQRGVVAVDPSRLRRNESPPRVVIEEVRAGDREWEGTSPVVVPPGARDLEIVYTALSFLEPRNVRLRYRLEGYDRRWVEAGNRRTAYYTGVPPGDYEFRVIAANNDGIWNPDGAALRLTIAPRWFERRSLHVALLGLALGGAVFGYRWRVRALETRRVALEHLVELRTGELQHEKEASDRAKAEAEHQREIAQRALEQVEVQAERLRDHDEAKSRFFTNVSHEFRTPLTLTIGPLQDLLDGTCGDLSPDALHEVEVALRSSRRLLGLINEILEIARLEAGEVRLDRRECDLADLVRQCCLAFTALAERNRVDLVQEGGDEPVIACVDPELLERVMTNLLSNAFRLTPPGGTIRVGCRLVGERARLTVEDSGPGVPPELRERIFERFFRGGESEGQALGSGIGLALCKDLIEMHEGTIHVTGAPEGGAAFVVTLPASPGKPAEVSGTALGRVAAGRVAEELGIASDISAGAGDSDAEDRTTVLLVDDNADLRAWIRRHLEPRFRVIEAADGTTGLERAREAIPDLLISDVMMPGMDGRELCRAVREDPELQTTPIVLLTAMAGSDDRVEGLATGADDYLTKPFEPRELVARVDNLIRGRLRLREQLQKEVLLHPRDPQALSGDEQFLERMRKAVEAGSGSESFGVAELADALGMSRGHLHRRLRELLGKPPLEVMRGIRLDRAAQLLRSGAGNVSEVAYATGFQSVSHFCRSFRQRFDCTPAQYRSGPDPPESG